MVLKDMRIFIGSAIILFLTLFFSCDKLGLYNVNCSGCTVEEPTKADLEIKLSLTGDNLKVINVYEGNLEDSILFATIRSAGTNSTYQVPLNKIFTLTATYNVLGKEYIAVDSAYPRVKYDKSSCQDPCYFVYNNVVDLKLRRTD